MKSFSDFISESFDNHINKSIKGLSTSKVKNSINKHTGRPLSDMKHAELKDGTKHQDVFDHLTKLGFKKTQGYDPNKGKWNTHTNHDSMTSKTDGIHNSSMRISAHIETEHGGKSKLHFTKWPEPK